MTQQIRYAVHNIFTDSNLAASLNSRFTSNQEILQFKQGRVGALLSVNRDGKYDIIKYTGTSDISTRRTQWKFQVQKKNIGEKPIRNSLQDQETAKNDLENMVASNDFVRAFVHEDQEERFRELVDAAGYTPYKMTKAILGYK